MKVPRQFVHLWRPHLLRYNRRMSTGLLLAAWLVAGTSAGAEMPGFTLQGRITLDKPATTVVLVLQDPREKNAEVARAEIDQSGNYSIAGLQKRSYRLVAVVDGKRQERRDIEILCRPGAIVSKDFHYGRIPSTLMLGFPAEDPDIVDVAELQGDYTRDVLRDYERAFQDYINGNPSRAVERLESITVRAPGFYGAHARLGVIYQQEGCYFDAESEYARSSELSPRSPQPLLNLASVQLRASDSPGELERMTARALSTLQKAIEIRPQSAIAHCLVGSAHAKANSPEEAEKHFKLALELDADFPAARLMLASLYLRNQNWGEAVESLETYLKDFPNSQDRSVVKKMLEDARSKARASRD
jgi:tetratricopeptide (TPR) repeat protein